MQRTSIVPRLAGAAICALLLAMVAVCAAQTQPQDRIVQPIDQSQVSRLSGNMHPLARAEFDRGRLDPSFELVGVSLNFKLSPGQQAGLDQLLAEQQDQTSPNYRKWLTPEQYAARFGMSPADLDRVTTWLQAQGFTDIAVSRGHTRVSFTGTAARVEAAFQTELHNYAVNGETHFANAGEPALPAAFAGTVLGIGHLNNFRPQPRARAMPASARFTSSVSGNHYLTPGDFATIYDITPLYTAGFDGTGINIAVVGQTQIDPNDISAFRSLSGLSVNPPQFVLVPQTGASVTGDPGDIQESDLDVEWSGGVAKNAAIIFVYAGSQGSAFDALLYAIDQDVAPVIGISYGNCESAFGASDITTLQAAVNQATAQGQTISAASGDAGAADCEDSSSTVATTGLAIDVPGAIPQVSSVGGSEFSGDNTTGSDPPYWAAATGGADNIDSALAYIPEMAWNDSPVTGTGTQLDTTLSAGGGGVSTLFTKPSWQTALTPADGHRDVPDISLSASPAHDGYLVCSQGSCVSGFRQTAGGNLTVFGGTSVSAQVFAGILGILNQATQSTGLGAANQELYALASTTPAAFHDITTGSNIVPCTSGTPSTGPAALRCPTTTPFQIGYSAATGYDLATGLGSIDVDALARAWPGFASAASFSVAADPVTIAAAGGSGNSTITVSSSSGFSGTVTLSCASPASATAQISCSFSSPTAGSTTSVALSNSTTSATATLNVTTTAAHAVSTNSAQARSQRRLRWFAASAGSLAAGILMIGVPSRRRRWLPLCVLLTCTFLAGGVACGGGSSSSSSGSGGGGGGTTTSTAATPTFNPASGTVASGTDVTLSDTTTGAKIYCTTDGTAPSVSTSSVCTGVQINTTTTINAIAAATGFNNSAVASSTYTVSGNPGTPAGSYVVTVTASSGSISHSANVAVTVQ